jgi:threonine dehydratase
MTSPAPTTSPAHPGVEGSRPDRTLLDAVTFEHVRAAAKRIAGMARRTPAMTCRAIDERTGARALLKCENLQRVGAFKFRGAANALAARRETLQKTGVLAYSSGNHAQAVALAAALLRIPAVIVMPTNAPAVKLAATRGYLAQAPAGSEVVRYDPKTTKREELGARIAAERGMEVVPPYDHPDVIAGQGTAALELFEHAGELDALYVCVGGGGLLSGCATVARALAPECEVIGVEPALADDATRSKADGVLRTVDNPPTIADGARTPYLGRFTFPIVMERVDRMRTVTEQQLAEAAVFAMQRAKLVVEPTGALALAGLLADAAERPERVRGRRVGVLISGGNLDLEMLPTLLELARGA